MMITIIVIITKIIIITSTNINIIVITIIVITITLHSLILIYHFLQPKPAIKNINDKQDANKTNKNE